MQSDQVVYGYYLKNLPVRYCVRAAFQAAVKDSQKNKDADQTDGHLSIPC